MKSLDVIDEKQFDTDDSVRPKSRVAIGFGIIAKLEQGAHLYFDQTRSLDGVWLLRGSRLTAVAHIAIVRRIGIEQVSTFDNFRKVPSGVEVVEDSTGK